MAFGTSVALIVVVCVPLALAPDAGAESVNRIYEWIASTLGVAYQWMTLGATLFLAWLAFGRYGCRRLGGADERPEFSTFSWVAMLFCAGVGAGLLLWATVEWAYYVDAPPFGVEPGSTEAIEWASTYGIFHWGLSAWCLYCFPTVAIAYPYYRNRVPYLRLSTGLHSLLRTRGYNSAPARAVDLVFIIALLGGTGTSLGLATPMIGACASKLLGVEQSFLLDVAVIAVCLVMFAISVYLGLDRGIKRLSHLNSVIALVLALFVILVGPTLFILQMATNSLGLMAQNFVRLNTWTDPIARTGFVEDWTVFYWAWWIAYGPFVGLFTTRISRGRTLRQLVLGMICFGTLGCALFYVSFGNYALYLDLQRGLPLRDLVNGGAADTAVAEVFGSLPGGDFGLAAFVLVALVFAATTYDSGSYTLASAATRYLPAGVEPARWHRLFWALALGVLPITLMFLGGLRAVQSAVLVVSLPLLGIGVLMAVALVRSLREEKS